ncbi:hypothetical protein Tco_0345125 [Tanacetum coccineum]
MISWANEIWSTMLALQDDQSGRKIHGAGVSTEDANQKLLRSLPSAWLQVSLIMRTKPGVDSLSFDDLYNNLRVFKSGIKSLCIHSSSCQNVALSFGEHCSTIEVSTLLNEYDLEEMDLKWQVPDLYENENVLQEDWMEGRLAWKFWKTRMGAETEQKEDSKAMDYPHRALKNKGIVDSGCSRHMTGNKAYLAEFQDFNGGPVAFGGSKEYTHCKGKIKIVLFTDSKCLVLPPEFKLPDENQVLLKIPRQNNMYSFNLENIVPSGGLACLIARPQMVESNKWIGRLGHVNFKNLNKLVKGNLVRGLPSKLFQIDYTCVVVRKESNTKASCKAKSVSSISTPYNFFIWICLDLHL